MNIIEVDESRGIISKCALPKNRLLLLYRLVYDVSQFLDSHGIRYFMDGGTLLGAVRHQKQIPWDDDLDFGLLAEDYDKLLLRLDQLPLGYKYEIHEDIIKIFIPNKWNLDVFKTIGTPTIDLFMYDIFEGNMPRQVISGKSRRKSVKKEKIIKIITPGWENAYHKYQNFYPLRQYQYGPLQLWGPRSGIDYCNRMYPDWQNTAIIELRDMPSPGHINNKTITLRADLQSCPDSDSVSLDEVKSVDITDIGDQIKQLARSTLSTKDKKIIDDFMKLVGTI